MRQQQNQNRRMRGRGNGGGNSGGGGGNNGNSNNRKGPNPLTRSYESNGPDVKVRGTAQHVAEKYMTLARDAQSSGDRVMAENYLQHAEHYNRIIAAAYAANPPQSQQNQNEGEEEGGNDMDDRFQSNPQPGSENSQAFDSNAPQPVIEGVPAEVVMDGQPVSGDRQVNGNELAESRERNPRRRPRAPRPVRAETEASESDIDALPSFIVQPDRTPEPAPAED
jgi:Domain of unknown function (DUF4167)